MAVQRDLAQLNYGLYLYGRLMERPPFFILLLLTLQLEVVHADWLQVVNYCTPEGIKHFIFDAILKSNTSHCAIYLQMSDAVQFISGLYSSKTCI